MYAYAYVCEQVALATCAWALLLQPPASLLMLVLATASAGWSRQASPTPVSLQIDCASVGAKRCLQTSATLLATGSNQESGQTRGKPQLNPCCLAINWPLKEGVVAMVIKHGKRGTSSGQLTQSFSSPLEGTIRTMNKDCFIASRLFRWLRITVCFIICYN